jgi:DNA-binding XRE family transcriptional regulator
MEKIFSRLSALNTDRNITQGIFFLPEDPGGLMVAVMRRRQPSDKPPHPLRQWRDQRSLSQEQLAEMTGISQGMISHIERYFRNPRIDILKVLLEHTGLPTDALILPERFLEEHPDFFSAPRPKPPLQKKQRLKPGDE